MKKVKLRVYYHWDIFTEDNKVPQIIKNFLLKNKSSQEKDVYYMIEDVKKEEKNKQKFFWETD